ELPQRRRLELTHPLARQAELLADRLERDRRTAEPEAQLDHPALALRQRRQSLPDRVGPERVAGSLLGIRRGAVGDEVAELGAVVLAHPLVQRHRGLDRLQRLTDVLQL